MMMRITTVFVMMPFRQRLFSLRLASTTHRSFSSPTECSISNTAEELIAKYNRLVTPKENAALYPLATPVRQCSLSRARRPRALLARLARRIGPGATRELIPDASNRLIGKGIYLFPCRRVAELSIRKEASRIALHEDLLKSVQHFLRKLSGHFGASSASFDDVESAMCVLCAYDAPEDVVHDVDSRASCPVFRFFSRSELARLLPKLAEDPQTEQANVNFAAIGYTEAGSMVRVLCTSILNLDMEPQRR